MEDEALRTRNQFQHVYQCGRSHVAADVVLVCVRNEAEKTRVAVVASRRVGKAVRRNRAKRLLRAAHRSVRRGQALVAADLVLIARPGAARGCVREIQQQVAHLYRQAGVFVDESPDRSSAGEASPGEPNYS